MQHGGRFRRSCWGLLNGRLAGPGSQCGHFGENKNSLSLLGIRPQFFGSLKMQYAMYYEQGTRAILFCTRSVISIKVNNPIQPVFWETGILLSKIKQHVLTLLGS